MGGVFGSVLNDLCLHGGGTNDHGIGRDQLIYTSSSCQSGAVHAPFVLCDEIEGGQVSRR